VLVLPPRSVGSGKPEGSGIGYKPQRPWWKLRHGEYEVIGADAVSGDVLLYLLDDLQAELELPVLPVLGVVLDEEAAALAVEAPRQLNGHPAHRHHPRAEIQIPGPQLGELPPAHAALDVGLNQQLHRVGADGEV
jgi:hypothetical protein